MATTIDGKPKGTINLEELKKNIVELQYRFQGLVNPEYEILELFDPNTKMFKSVRLNRVEFWEEWKRQERFMSFAQRNPFKRMGEVRMSTDDHSFQQISKVLEDFNTQVDLLSQFLALQAKPGPAENAVRPTEHYEYDLPEIPAAPVSAKQLQDLPPLPPGEPAPQLSRTLETSNLDDDERDQEEDEDDADDPDGF